MSRIVLVVREPALALAWRDVLAAGGHEVVAVTNAARSARGTWLSSVDCLAPDGQPKLQRPKFTQPRTLRGVGAACQPSFAAPRSRARALRFMWSGPVSSA